MGGRLPVAVEEMPGWDIFPYEVDSLRLKPIQPLLDQEPARRGEDPADCWCAPGAPPPTRPVPVVWQHERWRLVRIESGLPVMLSLEPIRHYDLADLPAELAAEFGQLIVAISAAIEALPSVGRTHLAKFGDGGAHLHQFFLGRPWRAGQLRGSPLLDWEENFPRVPDEVARVNAEFVAERVAAAYGGAVVRQPLR